MLTEERIRAEYWEIVNLARKEDLSDFRLGWAACLAYVAQINDKE
jgi:hypothetical protein